MRFRTAMISASQSAEAGQHERGGFGHGHGVETVVLDNVVLVGIVNFPAAGVRFDEIEPLTSVEFVKTASGAMIEPHHSVPTDSVPPSEPKFHMILDASDAPKPDSRCRADDRVRPALVPPVTLMTTDDALPSERVTPVAFAN